MRLSRKDRANRYLYIQLCCYYFKSFTVTAPSADCTSDLCQPNHTWQRIVVVLYTGNNLFDTHTWFSDIIVRHKESRDLYRYRLDCYLIRKHGRLSRKYRFCFFLLLFFFKYFFILQFIISYFVIQNNSHDDFMLLKCFLYKQEKQLILSPL